MEHVLDRPDDQCCLVGNFPDFVDNDHAIDKYSWVTRFNNTAGFGETSGSKISELVLVSRGGQAQEWIEDDDFINRHAIRAAKLITLVFPQCNDPGAECWFNELHEVLSGNGKTVTHISEADHAYAQESLRALGGRSGAALSSGYVYAHSRLRTRSRRLPPLHIFAFSFEGWNGHAWDAEKEWFRQQSQEGRLEVHPVRQGLRS